MIGRETLCWKGSGLVPDIKNLLSGPVRILLLEDDEDDQELIQRNLKEFECRLKVFRRLEDALNFLSVESVDIIIADLNVADSHGLATFKEVYHRAVNTPIIILSGHTEDSLALEAVRLGAQQYICKEAVNSINLTLQVQFALERHKLLSELIEARENARLQSRLKTDFIAHFSHEIRTPLNAVIGTVSLLDTNLSHEESSELIRSLSAGANRLQSILDDILDISKIEAGELALVLTRFNLRESVAEVMSIFASDAASKGLLLGNFFDPDVPTEIESDPKRLKQILLNLVSNAVKYTKSGHILISVSLQEKGLIRFSVKDTGRGLTEDEVERIFAPFMQAKTFDANTGTGLGLVVSRNLSKLLGGNIQVEKNIGPGSTFSFTIQPKQVFLVESHRQNFSAVIAIVLTGRSHFTDLITPILRSRGIIYKLLHIPDPIDRTLDFLQSMSLKRHFLVFDDSMIYENTSVLSSFLENFCQSHSIPLIYFFNKHFSSIGTKVKFPLHHSDFLHQIAAAFGELSPPLIAKTKSVVDDFQMGDRIQNPFLVVDDDLMNRKVLKSMLERLGVDCVVVESGEEALLKISAGQKFDVIFMDCSMPGMDGYETSRMIRSQGVNAVIIALTAHSYEEHKNKCMEAGMNVFLSKPIRVQQVRDAIIEVTKNKPFVE